MADQATASAGALEYRFSADWSQWEGAIARAQNGLNGFNSQNQRIASDASAHWERSATRIRDAMVASFTGMSSTSVARFGEMTLKATAASLAIDKLVQTIEKVSEPVNRLKALALEKTVFDSGLWSGITEVIAKAAEKAEVFFGLVKRGLGQDGDRNVAQFDAYAKSIEKLGASIGETASQIPVLRELLSMMSVATAEAGKLTSGDTVRGFMAGVAADNRKTAGVSPQNDLNNNPTKRVYSDLEAYRRLEAQLQRNVELQDLEGLALGMSAGEAARLRAQSELLAVTKGKNIALSEEQKAKLLKLIELEGQAADRAAMLKYTRSMTDAAQDQIVALRLEAETMGLTAEDVARLTFSHQQLREAQKQNIPVTDELRARIAAQAEEIRAVTKAAQDQKRTFELVASAGDLLRSSSESAFSNWLKTGRFSWKEFEREIMVGIAQIAIRAAMLRPLFGDNGQGGVWGGIAGAASRWWNGSGDVGTGSWAASVAVDGARAGGGPVWRGGRFLVGENGPEVVEFGAPGHVVPNGGGGSMPAVTVAPPNVSVNVTTPPGMAAKETGRTSTADGGLRLDVLIEQIDATVGRMIGDGRSSIGAAMAARHGLGAAVGAR